MYLTLSQLADLPGAMELAQVASNEHQAIVDSALMEASLRGADRSAWSSDDIALADAAIARINEVVTEVDDLIDGYLARRVTVPVPVPKVLVSIARAMVRYQLHKSLISDASINPIARDYNEKMKLLTAIRDGAVTLGASDPLVDATASEAVVQISGDERAFSREQTRGFR